MLKVQLKPLETEKLIFQKGWSRQQLANEAHVSMVTLCPILNGKPCRIKVALKIAQALDTDIDNIAIYEQLNYQQQAGNDLFAGTDNAADPAASVK